MRSVKWAEDSTSTSKSTERGDNEQGYVTSQKTSYGTTSRHAGLAVDWLLINRTVLIPFLLFAAVFYFRSMAIRYQSPTLAFTVSWASLLVVGLVSIRAAVVYKESFQAAKMGVFLCVACAYAWIAAFVLGDCNFKLNLQPYYDVTSLNVYDNVDPEKFRGQQLMDAGQIHFTKGSSLDLSLAYGFRNKDVYCIAPIVGPDRNATSGLPRYDFWAVGINCCSAHEALFKCGEYSNPYARSGLRLLRDDERGYFRLAVQGAEASYNIRSPSPVFMYWMESPEDEMNAYQDDGVKYLIMGLFVFFAIQVCLTLLVYGSERVLSAVWSALPSIK